MPLNPASVPLHARPDDLWRAVRPANMDDQGVALAGGDEGIGLAAPERTCCRHEQDFRAWIDSQRWQARGDSLTPKLAPPPCKLLDHPSSGKGRLIGHAVSGSSCHVGISADRTC
jgi:hypothetical protein